VLVPELRSQVEMDDDHYLKPNNTTSPQVGGVTHAQSTDSLDEEGYLKPTFNRYQRMNTTGSPDSCVHSFVSIKSWILYKIASYRREGVKK
jgi:hypothetical protein